MRIFCGACDEHHDFTLTDAERVVCSMQLALAVAETEGEPERLWSGNDALMSFRCLYGHLQMASSQEGYAEFVDGWVRVAGEQEKAS